MIASTGMRAANVSSRHSRTEEAIGASVGTRYSSCQVVDGTSVRNRRNSPSPAPGMMAWTIAAAGPSACRSSIGKGSNGASPNCKLLLIAARLSCGRGFAVIKRQDGRLVMSTTPCSSTT